MTVPSFFRATIAAVSLGLTACATPVDLDAPAPVSADSSSRSGSFFEQSAHRCNADPAQTLVGQTADENTEQQAQQLSGSSIVRTLRPGQVITMEYNPERVNLRVDENDIIETVGCG